MNFFQRINLLLRVTMELGIVLALGYWGFHTGKSESMKIILGVSSPRSDFWLLGIN